MLDATHAPETAVAARSATPVDPAWPDWRGKVVAIVASGHSARNVDVKSLQGRAGVIVFAVKEGVTLAPFADAVYGVHLAWWKHRKGLPEFKGLKFGYVLDRLPFPDVRNVEIPDLKCDALRFEKVGQVGAGGNSGFHALNLALQFGSRKIIGIGFDCDGPHFYGRNRWHKATNPDYSATRRWRRAFQAATYDLQRIGAEFINCSPVSAIEGFPKMNLQQALQHFGVA